MGRPGKMVRSSTDAYGAASILGSLEFFFKRQREQLEHFFGQRAAGKSDFSVDHEDCESETLV